MNTSNTPSRIVWEGSSWRLRVDSISPSGEESVEKGLIEHPGSVVLVPLNESAAGPEILMLRQHRQTLQSTILELPAGTKDWQEAWLDCAQRELREETGFRAGELVELGFCWPAPGITDEVMAVYLARNLEPDPLPQDADEIIEVQPMMLQDLVDMALDGRLKDAKSVVGILRTDYYLGRSHES